MCIKVGNELNRVLISSINHIATMTVGLVFILMEERECNYIWRAIMLVNISAKTNSCLLNSNGPVKFDRKRII